jgi:2,5-dihydroxypyridine 5,6-dioxygenase
VRLEARWIAMFEQVFDLCGVKAGDVCAVLSENATRPELPQLAELALARLGARVFRVVLPGQPLAAPVPVRSTGASDAIGGLEPVVAALAGTTFFADCTVEGLMHAPELPQILADGTRGLYISHEHPEILERCLPRAEDEAPVRDAMRRLKSAREMRVTSAAGTDLRIALAGARVGGVWGFTAKPGSFSHWPGGLVLDRGDVNLTFKRYLQDPVRLEIENDHAVRVEGEHVDAEMMRGHYAAWGDMAAYAVSHVGWGLNRRARWDAMAFYDRCDFNGTELRAFAGNFLYSTGANEVAGRHTLGHFDLPLRGCTVMLDGEVVVDQGRLP